MRSAGTVAILFFTSLLVITQPSTSSAQNYPIKDGGYRHPNIKDEHQQDKRKAQLHRFLEETMKKIEDHRSGRALLDDEELATMEKRKSLVEAKIQRMEERDDSEIEKMRRRSERRGRHTEL